MKKAKFALTAVAIFAVVGGALAFKASRLFTLQVYTQKIAGNCTEPVTIPATLNSLAGSAFTTTATTVPTPNVACTTIKLYANQ